MKIYFPKRRRLLLGFCVTVVLWSAQAGIGANSLQRDNYLPPPKPTLVAVHLPDLTQLESDVREQIAAEQQSLAAALKGPDASDAKLSAAYGAMGEIYHAYSLTAPARECYLNASQLDPKDFRWIYLLAKLDQVEGRADEAIRHFRIAASLKPDQVAVPVNLGNIYLELNRLEDAARSFSAALEIQKQSPVAHYGLGQVALSRRNYTEAVAHFEKALALAPAANRIHYALALAYRGLGDQEKVKTHLAQQGPFGVRVADPLVDGLVELVQGARLHLSRGKQALETKRYDEAAAEFRKAIASKPDSVPAHVNLGAVLTQLGDLKGAAEEFEKTLLIDPNNINAHFNLAVLSANANEHEQAIAHLKALVAIDPNDLGARFLLARELLKSDGAEALKLAQSLYAATGSFQHGALVGLALAELNRCDEAAAWQRMLIALAVQQRNVEWEAKLKADLERYQKVPCRSDR